MEADIQQLLAQLVQMLSGGSHVGAPTNPFSSGMYSANTGGVQAPMLQSMLGSFFPGMQPQVPPTMLMGDFRERQRRDAMRSQTQDQYYMSPVMARMASAVGMQKDQLRDPTTNKLTWGGSALSALYNSTLGPMMGDPWLGQGEMRNQMRDVYSGQVFGNRTGRGVQFGMSEPEINDQVTRMFGRAHGGPGKESIFNQGTFGAKEMFEVQRMGSERGLFQGANVSDIERRTEALAKTIKAGQAVFNTMDKEGVLDAIQDITQGQVPLSDSGSINTIMYKVAAMAKSANVSIELMKDLAAQGTALYKQVGIGGTAGAAMHIDVARMSQIATSNLGQGLGAGVSADTVARAGGQRAFSALLQQQAVSALGSPGVMNNAYLLEQMSVLKLPNSEKMMQKFMSGKLDQADMYEMMESISGATGASTGSIINSMEFEGGQSTERLMKKYGTKLLKQASQNQYDRLLQPYEGGSSVDIRAASQEKARVNDLAASIFANAGGSLTKDQARAQAEAMDLQYGTHEAGSRRAEEQANYWKSIETSERNVARTATALAAGEAMRPQGSLGSIFAKNLEANGGRGSLAFYQAAKDTIMGRTAFTDKQARDVVGGQATEAYYSAGAPLEGGEFYTTAAAMLGTAAFSDDDVRSGSRNVASWVSEVEEGKVSFENGSEAIQEKVKLAIESGGELTHASVRELANKEHMTASQIMLLAKNSKGTHYEDLKARQEQIGVDLTPDEKGKDLLTRVKEGQQNTPEIQALIEKARTGNLTDDELKKVQALPGYGHIKSKEDAKVWIDKGVSEAEDQQYAMAKEGGENMAAHMQDPGFAADVGEKATAAGKLGPAALEKNLNDLNLSLKSKNGKLEGNWQVYERALEEEGADSALELISRQNEGRQFSAEEGGTVIAALAKQGHLDLRKVKGHRDVVSSSGEGDSWKQTVARGESFGDLQARKDKGDFSPEGRAKQAALDREKETQKLWADIKAFFTDQFVSLQKFLHGA